MKYLSGKAVLQIHSDIIDETGGAHGIRDVGLFLSILEKPKTVLYGKEMYEGVFQKAATYFDGFARYHVFIDGNKRTAVATAARFLYENGFDFTATNKAIVEFTLGVVVKKIEIPEIASWLQKHTRKLKK
jgi:death on curing protein